MKTSFFMGRSCFIDEFVSTTFELPILRERDNKGSDSNLFSLIFHLR